MKHEADPLSQQLAMLLLYFALVLAGLVYGPRLIAGLKVAPTKTVDIRKVTL